MSGIDPRQLRDLIIKPAISDIGMYSLAAEQLLLCTAAHESECGRFLKQVGGGPALGLFQMEPATFTDITDNYLKYRHSDIAIVSAACGSTRFYPERMIHDMRYAAIFARIHYRRKPTPLPNPGDWKGIAKYWKAFYNTEQGKGTTDKFLADCERLGIFEIYEQ